MRKPDLVPGDGAADGGGDRGVEPDDAFGHVSNVLGRDRLDPFPVAFMVQRAEAVEFVEREQRRLCTQRLEADRLGPDQIRSRALELLLVDRILDDAPEFGADAVDRLLELVWSRCHVDAEGARIDTLDREGRDRVGEASPVAEFEEETTALAGEDLGQHFERRHLRVVDGEPREADHDVHLLFVLLE